MLRVVVIVFLCAAGLGWLSSFGYFLLLAWLSPRRRDASAIGEWPDITIVVPTLNEESFIARKLEDLGRTEYPGRASLMVIDGGSADATAAMVAGAIEAGQAVGFVALPSARGKADQVVHALEIAAAEIVVITDADARLEPSCVRELVAVLAADPATAVVGAAVRPESVMLEERLHWWFLNRLWWMEGEVLSAAIVPGVCYAARRRAVLVAAHDDAAEDVHLAMETAVHGWRVRLCREAHATELRVPQTAEELTRFRRRRGAAYVAALRRLGHPAQAAIGWRIAAAMRGWHFAFMPRLAAGLALLGVCLLATPAWPIPLLALAAFALPALAAAASSSTLRAEGASRWQLCVATGRLAWLTWLSLISMTRSAARRRPVPSTLAATPSTQPEPRP